MLHLSGSSEKHVCRARQGKKKWNRFWSVALPFVWCSSIKQTLQCHCRIRQETTSIHAFLHSVIHFASPSLSFTTASGRSLVVQWELVGEKNIAHLLVANVHKKNCRLNWSRPGVGTGSNLRETVFNQHFEEILLILAAVEQKKFVVAVALPFPEIKTTPNLRLIIGSFSTCGLCLCNVLSTMLVQMKSGSVHPFFLLNKFLCALSLLWVSVWRHEMAALKANTVGSSTVGRQWVDVVKCFTMRYSWAREVSVCWKVATQRKTPRSNGCFEKWGVHRGTLCWHFVNSKRSWKKKMWRSVLWREPFYVLVWV